MDVVLMEQFLEEAEIQKPTKPYAWSKIESRVVAIAEEELGKIFTTGARQTLKTYIDRRAREHAASELYEPRPPPYFGWDKMKNIWNQMWYPAPKITFAMRHKAMCVS
jgi:hypothetical protein